jgi:putative acetyltransferase
MEIRLEQPEDIAAIHRVNVGAFGRASEANLVDQLRGGAATFSFVAIAAEQIVGHVFYSPVTIAGVDDALILGLAPVAVLPDYQRQGIGSGLIRQSLTACARLGGQAVVVLGNPAYYQRFGFMPAKHKGLQCEYPVPDEFFMVLELTQGTLARGRGTVKYRPEFSDLE